MVKKKNSASRQMFSFEKVSFFDGIIPLDSPSESNSTQILRSLSQEFGSMEVNMPLPRKISKQRENYDSQFGQIDEKQMKQNHNQRQAQQGMVGQLKSPGGQKVTEKQTKNQIRQKVKEIIGNKQQGLMEQIQVLQKVHFKDMDPMDNFFIPYKFREEQLKLQQIQDQDKEFAQLYYGYNDSIKIQDQESKKDCQQNLKNIKKYSGQKIIKLKLQQQDQIQQLPQNCKQHEQEQKFNLPIESEQLKSQIQNIHQEIQQIIRLKERIDLENQKTYEIQIKKQQQQYLQNTQKQQIFITNQQDQIQKQKILKIQKNITIDSKPNSQTKTFGVRNKLSLYERIIEQNSNKPNMRLFVQMQNKFEPIGKTQTQKFDPVQLNEQINKMSESLPVNEMKKITKNLQIVNSVSTLIEPSFSIQTTKLQKQFNHKIKELQMHYMTQIQEQNDNFKKLFNQMKTQILHLQNQKSKLSDELYELHKEISHFKNTQFPKKQEFQILQLENQKLRHQIYQLRQSLNKHQNQSLAFHLKYEPLLQQIINSKLQQSIPQPTTSQIYDQMTFLYEKLQIKELQCQKLQLQKNQLYVELRRQKQKVKQLQITAQNQWNQNNLKYQALLKQLKILRFSYKQLLKNIQKSQIYPQIYFNTQNYKQQQKIQQQIKQSITKRYLNLNSPDNLQKKIMNQSRKSYLNPQQQQGLTRALRKKNDEVIHLSPKVERIKNKFSNKIQHYRTPSLQKLSIHLNSKSKQRSRRIIDQIKANIKLVNQQHKGRVENKFQSCKKFEQLRKHSPNFPKNLSPTYEKNVAVQNINQKLEKLRAEVRKQLQIS